MKQRHIGLDNLKGLASVLMLVDHVTKFCFLQISWVNLSLTRFAAPLFTLIFFHFLFGKKSSNNRGANLFFYSVVLMCCGFYLGATPLQLNILSAFGLLAIANNYAWFKILFLKNSQLTTLLVLVIAIFDFRISSIFEYNIFIILWLGLFSKNYMDAKNPFLVLIYNFFVFALLFPLTEMLSFNLGTIFFILASFVSVPMYAYFLRFPSMKEYFPRILTVHALSFFIVHLLACYLYFYFSISF